MNPTISLGNAKLGRIPNLSLPPGETCPGQTDACASVCYASNYMRVFKSTAVAYSRNLDIILAEDWTVDVMRFLSKKNPVAFRIHVAGDFFSPSYIDGWIKIIRLFPDTKFFGYTRSWRIKRLRPHLNILRNLPNVALFASCDHEANNAPDGWKRAHMGDPTSKAVLCPGYGPKELTCDACMLCTRKSGPDVYLPIH